MLNSSCESKTGKLTDNKNPINVEVDDWAKQMTSDDANYIISLNEWKVFSSWYMAEPKILEGSMEFKVITEFGDVYFKKNNIADGRALSFHVWGGVKGLIEIELGESGEISSSIYRPWSDDLTLMRTMIILVDKNDINF